MSTRLIESWLPIAELGEESNRERRSMTALPPTYYLHVWWARRPLVASRAAILASLLPEEIGKSDEGQERFKQMMGIPPEGDPIEARRLIDRAKRTGKRVNDPYGYPRAFGYLPTESDKQWFAENSVVENPVMLDPTAGGGSIPFEAVRAGISNISNDLNPVAGLLLEATVRWPVEYGISVLREYERLSKIWRDRIEEELSDLFPPHPDDDADDTTYLWSRTITCPYCGGKVPLSPNWKLASDGTGVRLKPNTEGERVCEFEIVHEMSQHSAGTVSRGDAQCPFPDCERVIDGDEVKRQAQAGQMGEQLYTIVYKRQTVARTKTGKERIKWERGYRAPRPEDDNLDRIRELLMEKLPEWEAEDIVPSEPIPSGLKTSEPHRYGMKYWRDLFNPRQLLAHGYSVEIFREMLAEEQDKGALTDVTKAAFGYLAISLDKIRDYNSRMTRWHSGRSVMTNTFDRHDFAFKWSYAELVLLIEGLGFDWALKQVGKSVRGLVELVRPDAKINTKGTDEKQTDFTRPDFEPPPITITCQSADNLIGVDDKSVDVVVMDPPYYDNVMYAELSDFFYVWLKRTAGYVFPELFRSELTDKDSEAVANPMRFHGQKHVKERSFRDYRDRMAAIFAECRRVLKDDGIMTVMFTHKATGAWDALATGLLEAGFTITASWPINTESESSLHIKDKASAKSTIFLVCRPRPERPTGDSMYWEDVEPLVTEAVRKKIDEYQSYGIRGVDLYLSCFGPALEEFAKHWPLKRGIPRPEPAKPGKQREIWGEEWDPYAVTPEDALDAARREVKQWRLSRLIRKEQYEELDPITEWFVLAWDSFQAPQFPYDEALKLARAVNVELEKDIIGRYAEKKASNLILWDSSKRALKYQLDAPNGSHAMLDALHHAAWRARKDTVEAANALMNESGAVNHPNFHTTLAALLEVLPVSSNFTRLKRDSGAVGEFEDDFAALEALRRYAFTEHVSEPEQLTLMLKELEDVGDATS